MSEHVDVGAYFLYGEVVPAPSASSRLRSVDEASLTSSEWNADGASWLERAMQHARLREELRAEHAGLTEEQLDAIAAMTVELRMVRLRLGSANATVLRAIGGDDQAQP